MNRAALQPLVEHALDLLRRHDAHLFEQNVSERCLAARLAHHLQLVLPEWSVDVEYNRDGAERAPKQLGLDEICANRRSLDGRAYVTPDLIVHRRGAAGPNLLVAELKKSSNPIDRGCDRARVSAFREQYGYRHGAIVELETREGRPPTVNMTWLGD